MTRTSSGKIFSIMIALMLALGAFTNIAVAVATDEATQTQWSFNWLKELLDGNADDSVLTETMKQALDGQGGMEAVIDGLQAQMGSVVSYGEPIGAEQQGMWAMVASVEFENATLQAMIVTDADGKVAGMLFQPWVEAAAVPLPDGAVEEEVDVDAGTGYPLKGTLTLPAGEGKRPAALLVWGSGTNDRDETVGGNRVFAQLASGLAERGVISII